MIKPVRSLAAVAAVLLTLLAVVSCELPPLYEVWEDFKSGELDITPSFVTLEKTKSITLTVTGGRAPYSYLNISGDGTLVPLDGQAVYTAPDLGADADRLILVTDAKGDESEARILVTATPVPLLLISPTMTSMSVVDLPLLFSASGGMIPYEFSLVSGAGTVNSTTGVYTPTVATTAEISVSDASGQSAEATVIVSAGPPPLVIDPPTLQIETVGTATLTPSGGTAPYTYSVISGAGAVDPGPGPNTIYTPAGVTVAEVRVTDFIGQVATSTVTVTLPALGLAIVPQSLTIAKFRSFQFQATGGSGSYEFKMVSGFGSITLSGLYTASGKVGTEKVRVTDTITGVRKKATIKVKKK